MRLETTEQSRKRKPYSAMENALITKTGFKLKSLISAADIHHCNYEDNL